MARPPGGPHLQSKARGQHGFQSRLPNPRKHALSIILACAVLLSTSAMLSSRFSVPSNDFPSSDIGSFLSELDELSRDAGDDSSQLQLRLLRLAAGVDPGRSDRATRVFSELLSSIESLGHTLPCMTVNAVQGPQNSTGCSKGCFFAANLYNSVEVLPNMILQLLAVLGSLGGGEHAQRCFVSVYESGSTDSTPELLDMLRRILDVLGVPNRIVTRGDINREQHLQLLQKHQGRRWLRWGYPNEVGGDERIRFLADLRNAVLEPLLEPPPQKPCATGGNDCVYANSSSSGYSSGGGGNAGSSNARNSSNSGDDIESHDHLAMDRVVFINDVFFCPADVRRLLRYDSADVACGLDFVPAALWLLNQPERERLMADHLVGSFGVPRRWAEWLSRTWLSYKIWKKAYGKSRAFWAWSFPVFYDMWVTRDVSGARIRNREPYSIEPWTADRLAQGLPTPAYCCWNGLVNLRAEPFLRNTAMGTRGSLSVTRRSASAVAAESGIADGTDVDGHYDGNDDYGKDRREAASGTGPRRLPLRFRSHRFGECAASECSLMCDDLHAAGYHRVLLEPNVRVAYHWSVALSLYGNFDRMAPEDAPGLRYRHMAAGDARQVEVSWDDDWLPRVEAGARSVECCGIQPGRQTADFNSGCAPRDMTESWWSGEPVEAV
ncbi:hypothetical protein VaNZ11_016825 [Volvox africanus]|uniref:Alpha-1,3-mannosyltransferase CMT1 n=1 Tax=Volvox africanus TaxID=51714 RepID=A0ABQ5SQ48_9CHLO|nr:hypothetical protein VaNZ11_016825 [Volvox africanus]